MYAIVGIRMQFDKVVVVGLGQLGLPVAKYVKAKGFEVYGYDANIEAIDRAESVAGSPLYEILTKIKGGSKTRLRSHMQYP